METCRETVHIDEDHHGGGFLACWRPEGHDGPHYDLADDLTWQTGWEKGGKPDGV